MMIVLDASAAVEIALGRQFADVFKNHLLNADLVIAPDTYPSEITNVFWKYFQFENLSEQECADGISFCLDLIDDFIDSKSIWREVLTVSMETKHPVYDIFYLISARRNSAFLLTRDQKLKSVAEKMGITTG